MTDTQRKTKSLAVAEDVSALLRARNPLLWVVTREEARVEQLLIEAAAAAGYGAATWDISEGGRTLDNQKIGESADPNAIMASIRGRATDESPVASRTVWILRDLPVWFQGMAGAKTMRALRNLARTLPGTVRNKAQSVVVITPSTEIPPELQGHATVIEWPLPDRDEIAALLDAAVDSLPDEIKADALPDGTRDAAVDAAVGLSGEEASACYARSLVQFKRIDPTTVASEKRRVIARERVLEWFDPIPGGLDAVGGLENLKAWLVARKSAYSPEARAYGLPAPKGALLVGISGCGKSLTAKAIATAWGVPLLRFDAGALKSKFVGESEQNIRKAFKVIEAIGRCVVWIDEIEKAMQGATSGSSDGGVSSDALGTILQWMQERRGDAFVIATANDISGLPPELLRKGRFDEIWWVDLPTPAERVSILNAALRAHGRGEVKLDYVKIANKCDAFTGAEIAAIVPDALFAAFADKGREINTVDLLDAAENVVPLSVTMKDKIDALRTWAEGKARPATKATTIKAVASRGHQIDL